MKQTVYAAIAFAFALMMSLLPLNAQTAQPPIKIGVLTEMSGAYADVGGPGSVVAAQMAVADFGGSVLGMPISVISGDHQSKADVAMAIAGRWFDVDGVDLIVDLSNSAAALAVQGLAKDRKRITIVSTAATDILTNQQCSPYGAHWTYDSYSVGKTLASAMGTPGSTWFFLTANYAGGRALQTALSPFLEAKGAKILGSVRHPLNTGDMSSFLMQAQASGAKYIALANAGTDLINTMKQASEFGLSQGGQTLVCRT